MVGQITNAFRSRQTINPKTVLGFYATVLGLLLTATVGAVGILAQTGTRTDLIPWLLTFGAVFLVLLILGVFVVTLIDPSKLMLTQVTGSEYAAIQHRAIIGDSTVGELVGLPEALSGLADPPTGDFMVMLPEKSGSGDLIEPEPEPANEEQ